MSILLIFPGFIVAFIIITCYEWIIRRTKPRNKVHFYVARDMNGPLWLYMGKPCRGVDVFYGNLDNGVLSLTNQNFSRFGLNEDNYANLKWEDEPVEVFLNFEN